MTPDTQVSFALICSLIAAVGVIYNAWSNSKKSNKEEISGIIKANMKLDEVCRSLSEQRIDIRSMMSQVNENSKKLAEHDERIKIVEKKVEDL